MKKIKHFIIVTVALLSICNYSVAQTPILIFDGIDDYIDIGTNAGNGARTVELWFRLENPIGPALSQFSTLISREIDGVDNTGEFQMSFQPNFVDEPGKLRFDIDGTQPFKSVYSDNNTWNADKWYHVAAVIDPVEGMMLFIDGVKQMSTHPHSIATATVPLKATTIGTWGGSFGRNFNGALDDIRISSEAMYSANFTPPCPDIPVTASTIGLWNLNEGTGIIASDSGVNGYNAQIVGASWGTDIICNNTGIEESNLDTESILKIHPNPSYNEFHLKLHGPINVDLNMIIYDCKGQLVYQKEIFNSDFSIDLSNKSAGIYYYQLFDKDSILHSGKLVKK